MKISTEDINIISIIMLNHVIENGFSNIEVDVDYYWHISLDSIYNEPDDILVGSLVDDLECLQKIISGYNILTLIDFDRIGHLIKTIGFRVYKLKKETATNSCVSIDINKAKYLCAKILNKVKRASFNNIDLDKEFYLTISSSEAYDLEKSPTPTKRSVFDDWKSLKEILLNKRQIILDDFDRLGMILKVLGDVINNSKDKVNWLAINE